MTEGKTSDVTEAGKCETMVFVTNNLEAGGAYDCPDISRNAGRSNCPDQGRSVTAGLVQIRRPMPFHQWPALKQGLKTQAGDTGLAVNAEISDPTGVAVDSSGNL
jgi:hypothetical protein